MKTNYFAVLLCLAFLSVGCGGSGGSGATPSPTTGTPPPTSPPPPGTPPPGTTPPPVTPPPPTTPPPAASPPTSVDASRFLMQSTYGPTTAEIERVKQIGYDAWITQQFNTPSMDTHWAYVTVRGGPIGKAPLRADEPFGQSVLDIQESVWTQAIKGPDQLRQRTTFALSQIFVISMVQDMTGAPPAAYYDMLSRNAFGNFRTLLEDVSTHPTMGKYLSHINNLKEDPATGRLPDENFAREVMQLFTIGLWELNEDGTRRKDASGKDIPTYVRADVSGLAKVFTGWGLKGPAGQDFFGEPLFAEITNQQMTNYAAYHSTSEKKFLGTTIPAGTNGVASLRIALDTLFNHRNTGPFIGKQLIQRLVTSNPSPAYVGRVARAFANNGAGVRGDMKAVIRAILMDPEARDASKLSDPQWGKLREPVLAFSAWLRAFDAQPDKEGRYPLWYLNDPATSLGQSPLLAPSVFNFYRPTYAPPGEVLQRGYAAPEFQITHATSVAGYANFVGAIVDGGAGYGTILPRNNYATERALAENPGALLDHLNVLLTAGQMSANTRNTILPAINAIPASEATDRVKTAIVLVMLSPDFVVQK